MEITSGPPGTRVVLLVTGEAVRGERRPENSDEKSLGREMRVE